VTFGWDLTISLRSQSTNCQQDVTNFVNFVLFWKKKISPKIQVLEVLPYVKALLLDTPGMK
jgi:hypothetical protein